jgi:type VI secretion system ImpM family protein
MSGEIGFYGKLPCAGDFVQRRLPAAFVDTWDRHFQRAVDTGRRELGGEWPLAYRGAPAWRFVMPAQVCGDRGGGGVWCGLVGPAEDRVGRGFPMVLAARWAGDPAGMFGNDAWFDALERVYRGAQLEAVSVESFDARVAALPHPFAHAFDARQTWDALDWDSGHWALTPWQGAASCVLLTEAWRQLCARAGAWCLWWTREAGRLLATCGLPLSYAVLLDAAAPHPAASVRNAHVDERREPFEAPFAVEPNGNADDEARPSPGTVQGFDAPAVSLSVPETIATAADVHGPDAAPAASDRTPRRAAPRAAPPAFGALAEATLLQLDDGRTLLISADDGAPPDARRRAALSMRAAALDSAPDLASLQANLLALHMPLRAAAEDPLEPVREEGVALAARFAGGRVQLMRIGAAAAWHARHGVMRPLFVERAAGAGGEFDDLLFGDAWLTMPGLGTPEPPHVDEAGVELEAGDRLVLLATRSLAKLPPATIAQALSLPACDDARAHLAVCAGLGTDPTRWPLAVIGGDA